MTRSDLPPSDPHAPAWGDPPIPDVLAALLAERYPLADGERFEVDVQDEGLAATLRGPGHQTRICLKYEAGARSRDPWELLVDALDALIGQLVENGRQHRALPVGSGVEWDGARFQVEVEKDVPELRDLADRWLSGDARRG